CRRQHSPWPAPFSVEQAVSLRTAGEWAAAGLGSAGMKIHIDFDDRLFDEPTWDSLYMNAKALRHILRGLVDMVEIYGKRVVVEGERRRCIVLRIDLLLGSRIASDSVEFSTDGYWRSYDYGARVIPPFEPFMPDATHSFDRDLINRPELRMDILYDAMRAWF